MDFKGNSLGRAHLGYMYVTFNTLVPLGYNMHISSSPGSQFKGGGRKEIGHLAKLDTPVKFLVNICAEHHTPGNVTFAVCHMAID